MAGAAVATLALGLPFLIPATAYKGPIEADRQPRHRAAPSRSADRCISRCFRMTGIEADDVALANMPLGRTPAMMTARDVRVGVLFAPLLAGRIEVSTVVVDRPVIALEVDAAGRANWTFARSRKSPGTGQPAQPQIKAHFSGLTIVHGRITYFNARTGSTRTFDDVDATVASHRVRSAGRCERRLHPRRATRSRPGEASQRPNCCCRTKPTALDLSVTSDLLRADSRARQPGRSRQRRAADRRAVRRAGGHLAGRASARQRRAERAFAPQRFSWRQQRRRNSPLSA